ncbi:MAG: fatty acid cis/trans isomerase [Bdellovibrionaceae bacterium]|nr:fatty acid cis/trans isomerase [Pseudobdellovibrionaceae bacterium]
MKKIFFLFLISFLFIRNTVAKADEKLSTKQNLDSDYYQRNVKPIFESRCMACHSCYNAPCQLNLQTYEGFERGGVNKNIYDGLRLKSVDPTRMFIDAKNTEEWRKKGFHSVNNSTKSSENILMEVLRIRRDKPDYKMLSSIEGATTCPKEIEDTKILGIKNPELGMPFGFPPLNDREFKIIEEWIEKGAPHSVVKLDLDQEILAEKTRWEEFLNQDNLKQKLVSRYLYEHLFLAHLYFPKNHQQFFTLVRSKNKCNKTIDEIASRRPNDSPGGNPFYYCLKSIDHPVVYKTHMPFELNNKKLEFWRELFFASEKWDIDKLPDYSPEVAQNPFVAYAAIPGKIKYQFLLSDAQFHIMTFIKGPVCNGTNAVNSIQEQFYTFFLAPNSDPMSDHKHQLESQTLLTLPGSYGSDVEVTSIPSISSKITELREEYRKLRLAWLKQHKPKGLGLEDIWDGDKINDNAVLTIFRHNDNAVVMKGAVGNLSKTLFVLDYSLFERLVYNLVVNFDVFGNVGHQLLTRVYMDFIRMEAEENFLLFISPEKRQHYRQSWYQGVFTEAKMKYIFPEISKGEATSMKYKGSEQLKTQFVNQVLSGFTDKVRGEGDSLNWRNVKPEGIKMASLSDDEKLLKKITSIKSMGKLPFARYFPETSYLILRKENKIKEVYSLIHNREFQNISWIIAEKFRRAPHEDTLTLKKGFWISYPELIFDIDEKKLSQFVEDIREIENIFDYPKFEDKYKVSANDPKFWQVWDDLHQHMRTHSELEFGFLDLTRYLR